MESPATSSPVAPGTRPAGGRCRRRTVDPEGTRPSDVVAAFFAAGLAMLGAAAAALVAFVVDGTWWLQWLALHLALLGGVSQLVLGAAQFFVCAFLATTPPSRRLLIAQLAVWNLGTALVAVGIPVADRLLVDCGGGLIGLGLLLFAVSLRAMQRRSLQRARWAVRWYQVSASCLAAGALVGMLLAGGVAWRYGSLLGAHMALNLVGWLGTAIVGTLHTFFPSLTGTRLRFERLQGSTLALWAFGVLAVTASAAFSLDALAVVGWVALAVAAALLATNVLASLRACAEPLSLPARMVALAQGFLVVGLGVAVAAAAIDGAGGPLEPSIRPVLAALLVAGWIGLTVTGSLLHLLAVLARVRHLTRSLPAPRPVLDGVTTALCGVAVVAWALVAIDGLASLAPAALALRVAATVLVGAHVLRAALRVGRSLVPKRVARRSSAPAVR
ncbi:MAG TPA: hypothetical protein VFW09_00030 [Solirubrobacteraceae bacterium]|nr:hypothetical protein [Solirubrobacteraceae bacterium]